jgi:hypothetical protein
LGSGETIRFVDAFSVTNIPTDGSTLYLTLRSRVGLTWHETQSSYPTQGGAVQSSQMH